MASRFILYFFIFLQYAFGHTKGFDQFRMLLDHLLSRCILQYGGIELLYIPRDNLCSITLPKEFDIVKYITSLASGAFQNLSEKRGTVHGQRGYVSMWTQTRSPFLNDIDQLDKLSIDPTPLGYIDSGKANHFLIARRLARTSLYSPSLSFSILVPWVLPPW